MYQKILKYPSSSKVIVSLVSPKKIKPPAVSDHSLVPRLNYVNNYAKIQVKFHGSCLKEEKVTFNYKVIINLYIVYKMNLWPFDLDNKFTLLNFLLVAEKLAKN